MYPHVQYTSQVARSLPHITAIDPVYKVSVRARVIHRGKDAAANQFVGYISSGRASTDHNAQRTGLKCVDHASSGGLGENGL